MKREPADRGLLSSEEEEEDTVVARAPLERACRTRAGERLKGRKLVRRCPVVTNTSTFSASSSK